MARGVGAILRQPAPGRFPAAGRNPDATVIGGKIECWRAVGV